MKVCTRCHYQGRPGYKVPGSFAVELVLWMCFLLPGLIYSVWRHSAKHEVCAYCGNRDLLPADSPKGQALASEIGGQAQRTMQDQLRGKAARLRANRLTAFAAVAGVVGLIFLLGESTGWGLVLVVTCAIFGIFAYDATKKASTA